jgi:hypothetical protein
MITFTDEGLMYLSVPGTCKNDRVWAKKRSKVELTVGAEIMACTKIMARSTSSDDFMHLKTSHIKSRVIL